MEGALYLHHGRRKGVKEGLVHAWSWKLPAKRLLFFISSEKTIFHHFWLPLENFWKNPLVATLGKNPSGARDLHNLQLSTSYIAYKSFIAKHEET